MPVDQSIESSQIPILLNSQENNEVLQLMQRAPGVGMVFDDIKKTKALDINNPDKIDDNTICYIVQFEEDPVRLHELAKACITRPRVLAGLTLNKNLSNESLQYIMKENLKNPDINVLANIARNNNSDYHTLSLTAGLLTNMPDKEIIINLLFNENSYENEIKGYNS